MLTSFDIGQPGLTIKIPVKVMSVVTDKLRQELAKECQENLQKLDFELEQLAHQQRRLGGERPRPDSSEAREAEKKLQEETSKRQTQRVQWRERLKEVAELVPGTLLLQGTAEALVSVEAGMNWNQLDAARIILKDGVIVEAGVGPNQEVEPCDG